VAALRLAGLAACWFAGAALATPPNEIKVFTDELAAYREHTLETHVNKGSTGPLQVMPEYSYGIARDWEFSLQLPFAFTSDSANGEGYRVELQYVAPHDGQRGLYWGINMELARNDRVDEPRSTTAEIIPILGYRSGRWHLVANPGFEHTLSGERDTAATPSAKVAYQVAGKNFVGFEAYADAGDSRTLYVAWDGRLGKSDINVGFGRGYASAADRWVLKAICEIAF